MSDLDDKLMELLFSVCNRSYPDHEYGDDPGYVASNKELCEEFMTKIKKAFADAGYLQSVRMGGKTIVMNGKDPLGYVVYYPHEADRSETSPKTDD